MMKYRGIIISGLPCSGKSTLIKELKREYGLEVFSFGQMWRDKWKRECPDESLSFQEWWGKTPIEENKRVNVEGRDIIASKDLIVDSRYSAFYCKDLPYLRIFLNADLEIRAERDMVRQNEERIRKGLPELMNFYEFKTKLKERDDDELRMGLDIFGEDYRDQIHYHAALDTNELTVEREFERIKALMAHAR